MSKRFAVFSVAVDGRPGSLEAVPESWGPGRLLRKFRRRSRAASYRDGWNQAELADPDGRWAVLITLSQDS